MESVLRERGGRAMPKVRVPEGWGQVEKVIPEEGSVCLMGSSWAWEGVRTGGKC